MPVWGAPLNPRRLARLRTPRGIQRIGTALLLSYLLRSTGKGDRYAGLKNYLRSVILLTLYAPEVGLPLLALTPWFLPALIRPQTTEEKNADMMLLLQKEKPLVFEYFFEEDKRRQREAYRVLVPG